MILQQKMSLFSFAEVFPDHIFADGDKVFIGLGTSFVFQHFDAIEVMLHVIIGVDDDATGIPLSDGSDDTFWFVRGDQVVKAGQRTVSISSQFGVGVERVVEQLVFEADR